MFKNVYTTRMSGNSRVLKRRFRAISAKPVKLKGMLAFICAVAIFIVSTFSTLAVAQFANESIDYNIDITNNGQIIELKNKLFIENGEVYVPLRELFTKLGLMEGENAKMEWLDGVVLISLSQKNLNDDVIAEYTSYLYKIEIGKSELVVNPRVLMHENTPENVADVGEAMRNAPVLRRNITYIPFSYAERMIERADLGFLSPANLYKLEFACSGEIFNVGYPFTEYHEIAQSFGKRVHPITGEEHFHSGIDFKAEEGTPVLAGIEGKFDVGYDEEKGAYMTIYGENGVEVTYCHLQSDILRTLWNVNYLNKGSLLGFVGNTGKSTGPHLHMEVKVNGEYVDPEEYIIQEVMELLQVAKPKIESYISYFGYADAEYKVTDFYVDSEGGGVTVSLTNYDDTTIGLTYYKMPYGWQLWGVYKNGELMVIYN